MLDPPRLLLFCATGFGCNLLSCWLIARRPAFYRRFRLAICAFIKLQRTVGMAGAFLPGYLWLRTPPQGSTALWLTLLQKVGGAGLAQL